MPFKNPEDAKAWGKLYYAEQSKIPGFKERRSKYYKEYISRPEAKQHKQNHMASYYKIPEVQEHRKKQRKEYYVRDSKNPEIMARNLRYREEHREKKNAQERKLREKRRMMVLEHYGGMPPKCACCGEREIKFLSIDHINGDGKIQRKIAKDNNLNRWLIKNNFPDGIQILCHNCNLAKGFYGKCPHLNLSNGTPRPLVVGGCHMLKPQQISYSQESDHRGADQRQSRQYDPFSAEHPQIQHDAD